MRGRRMNSISRKARRLAEQLLRFESVPGKRAAGNGTAVARACGKLGAVLGPLVGALGFRTLLDRALTLAKAEVPGMSAVQVGADGVLVGLGELEAQSGNGKIAKGEVILVAHLLGLLIVFLGEALTLGLVQDVWPKATLDHFGSESVEGDNL